MKVKVISYNVWHGKYLNRLVDFLKEEQADVVCLQEVGTKNGFLGTETGLAMFEELKKQLNYEGMFERMFWAGEDEKEWDMGLATLSRWKLQPIESTFYYGEVRRYPGGYDEVCANLVTIPRVIQISKLVMGGEELVVGNTHFTLTKDAVVTEQQLRDARALREITDKYEEYLLMGDMNTPHGTETYKVLGDGMTDLSLQDKPTLHPKIHKAGQLGYHVDYIFSKSERLKLLSSRVPVVDASDHLPIVIEIELIKKEN